jgi:cytochrome c oxidase subunit 2
MGCRVFLTIIGALPVLFFLFIGNGSAETIPDPREGWDELWRELMIDIIIIGVIFAAVTIYLLIRYRRRHPDEVGNARELSPLAAFGWVIIPAFVFMADDLFLAAKSFDLWNKYRNVPPNPLVIDAEGYMWGWDFMYQEGITTTNELRVPAGRHIKIRLTSRDVVHSFFIPDYRVKWDSVPGKENYLWFYPKNTGEHIITCTEFCGALHSNMFGKVIAMPEDEFNRWIEENKAKGGGI